MSSEPVSSLHLIAHRAAGAPRNVEDWWGSPLETALAAVAASRHSRAYRADAERTADRLLRWWNEGDVRPISADVCALALTARACADLQHSNTALVDRAATDLAEVAGRDAQIVPLLHLALGAWALDRLVPGRDDTPWPALRERLDRPASSGVDAPLRALASALAAPAFDASALVQGLLGLVGASPGLSEASILLWVLTVAIERVSETLPASDSGLQVLCGTRAELVERLAGEIDHSTFSAPEIDDFNPEAELDLRVIAHLSPFEALLLDLALASSNSATPWLSFEEARELFGAREAEARNEQQRDRRRLMKWIASLTLLGGVALGALAAPYYGWGPSYYYGECVPHRRIVGYTPWGRPIVRFVRACY